MNRRFFLKTSGIAFVGSALVPNVFVRMAEASTTKGRNTIVAIFQRGAVDGLNMIVPYGEQAYYAARPSIAIPRAGSTDGAIDLDGFFGLHPAMATLKPLFANRSLAIVHAVGSPDASRSHFDAQDFMENGTPGRKTTPDGFLARALNGTSKQNETPLRGVALASQMPRILTGAKSAIAMSNVAQFGIRGGAATAALSGSFEEMYAATVQESLNASARDSFEAVRLLKAKAPEKITPKNGAQYPRGPLGDSLKQIAQLIHAEVGLEVAFTDVNGWDTHAAEGGTQGQLANQLRLFSQAIAAFVQDLGSRMNDVTLVTMSEFGRTVKENGNRGTDHGHGNVMLLSGGGVKGGEVYGKWPGLRSDQLFENRDLAVTTDFRDVFAELLVRRLGVSSPTSLFPGYSSTPSKWLHLIS